MVEEITKALTPWPLLQYFLGLLIFLGGVWFIVRGVTGKEGKEDERERWETYQRVENIERDIAKIRESNQRLLEAIQQLTSILWNYRQ